MMLSKCLGLAIVLATGFCGTAAQAGDAAQLNVIGYSSDGSVFAFEEFGIQDGAGFAYSNIFAIDTRTDKFVEGTPIRVLIDDETSLKTIRAQAAAKFAPLVERFGFGDDPGLVVAHNPPTEIGADPFRIRYYAHPLVLLPERAATLVLSEIKFPPSEKCLNMVGEYTGFKLVQTEADGQAVDILVHEDAQIPASRNCPNGYRLAAVVNSENRNGPTVAMVQVSSFGFEGNDLRWIALPVAAKAP